MAKRRPQGRRIALFVEGDSERGDARRKTLPAFFHNWLDPQLPPLSKVGIHAIKFQGVSDFLDNVGKQVELYLTQQRANVVVGLVDLYGIPRERIDLSKHSSVRDKVVAARGYIRNLVGTGHRDRFRQHFAVHEIEAWLLAYPQIWPSQIRSQILKRPPEQVNFGEPPAKFLKRILGGTYKKTISARNHFPAVDPQIAIDKCPFLSLLAQDLLEIARRLQ